MNPLTKAVRFTVVSCFSLVLLYCGIGMIMGLVLGRTLPAFPVSWVGWFNRPGLPPLLNHVINFLLTSMAETLFKDAWRQAPARRPVRSSSAI